MTFLPRHNNPDDSSGDDAGKKDAGPDSVLGGFIDRFKAAAATPPSAAGLLQRAAERGDVAGVAAQLAAGAAPDAANSSGQTALHLAARKGHAEVVALLITAGANLQATIGNDPQRTPLHEAINFGAEAAAEELLRHGAYVPEKPGGTSSLLHRAAEKGKTRIVQALLQAGADPMLTTATGVTPLMAALNAKHNATAMAMLETPAVMAVLNLPMRDDAEGRSLFHLAIMRGDAALITAMVKKGAFVNRPRGDGMTPLHLAIMLGNAEVVAALVNAGADVRHAVTGRPPLMKQLHPAPLLYLCGFRNMNEDARGQIARLLIDAGADVNAPDAERGDCPLHRIVQSCNVAPAMKVLLEAGAAVDRRDRRGATALMLAVEDAAIHEMTNLLAAKADPNARHGQNGRTALMLAAALGQTEMMTELLQAGADPRAVDNDGQSVLDYARANLRMAGLTVPVVEAALARPPRRQAQTPGVQP